MCQALLFHVKEKQLRAKSECKILSGWCEVQLCAWNTLTWPATGVSMSGDVSGLIFSFCEHWFHVLFNWRRLCIFVFLVCKTTNYYSVVSVILDPFSSFHVDKVWHPNMVMFGWGTCKWKKRNNCFNFLPIFLDLPFNMNNTCVDHPWKMLQMQLFSLTMGIFIRLWRCVQCQVFMMALCFHFLCKMYLGNKHC